MNPIMTVAASVARARGVELEALLSASRIQEVRRSRQEAMFLASTLTPSSPGEIARVLGRDHHTVRHALRVTRERMDSYAGYRDQIAKLRAEILAKGFEEAAEAESAVADMSLLESRLAALEEQVAALVSLRAETAATPAAGPAPEAHDRSPLMKAASLVAQAWTRFQTDRNTRGEKFAERALGAAIAGLTETLSTKEHSA